MRIAGRGGMGEAKTKLRIRALETAIKHLNSQRCPVGEWPSVKILREWRDELMREARDD